MPGFIVKPVAEEDFYVRWSTVVDAPTDYGTRQELEDSLGEKEGAPERFTRADELGSSMCDPALPRDQQWFGWHERSFILMEWEIPDRRHDGHYEIPRENIRALCEQPEDTDPTRLLIFIPDST